MTDKAEIAIDYWENHSASDAKSEYVNIIKDAQANGSAGNASILIARGYNLAKFHKVPAPVVQEAKAEAEEKPTIKKKRKQ